MSLFDINHNVIISFTVRLDNATRKAHFNSVELSVNNVLDLSSTAALSLAREVMERLEF